jgi:hypothetical protein
MPLTVEKKVVKLGMKSLGWRVELLFRINRLKTRLGYYHVRNFFFPQNKWLMKGVPRCWRDKDELFRVILFNGLVHYVEGEKCFEVIEWGNNEKDIEVAAKIKEIYAWIKEGRPAKEKELEQSYPNISIEDIMAGKTPPNVYDKVYKVEAELENKDTEYLTWIVQNRRYLWT